LTPQSVLGAVVIVNLKAMLMQFREVPYLWRRDKPDCVGSPPRRRGSFLWSLLLTLCAPP